MKAGMNLNSGHKHHNMQANKLNIFALLPERVWVGACMYEARGEQKVCKSETSHPYAETAP